MTKKVLQRVGILAVIAALVIVPVLAMFEAGSGSEFANEVPRMLGMEGIGESETASLDGPPSTNVSGPIFEVHGKAASFDKNLRDLPQTGPKDKKPAREMGTPPNMGPNGNGIDSVMQGAVASSAPAPAPSSSFAGLDLNNWGAGWPPDTHGDVGPNYYIQVVNTSIGVFDKSTGSRQAAFTFNSFFQANGATDACATLNYGDPVALYDQVSGRWIITDFAFAGSGSTPPYYECIAVSKTGNPMSGGWWLYTVVADTQSLNDYPKLGIWNDGIYMSANMFKRGRSYAGVKVWALNRDDLISGAALRTVAFDLGNSYFSLLPANVKGANPPAGTPEYFMSDYGSNTSMKLWKFHVDWNTPSASTITGPTSFAVASFTRPSQNSVPQKNSSELLDTLGDRLMTWLQYRNIGGTESLWVSRTVVSGSTYGIRWMEVRNMGSTPSVYQQGTYAPDANYRWMPSLAVNQNGDMAVGYSVSSSNMFPAIRYAGRLASDPLGSLGQTETSLIEGTGSQSGGYNRWGDYSSMSVDPTDDCTFWYTTEYYTTTGNDWQTRIGSFKLADCGGTASTVPGASTLSASAGDSVVHLTWTAPFDGGSPITNYKVYRGTSSGSETLFATLGNVTSFDDTSVANGSTYYYEVSAVNNVGEGAQSNEVSATPQASSATVPSAPTLSANAGNTVVSLSWTTPSSDGGSSITNYNVYRGTSSGGETLLTTLGNVNSYNDTTVTNGTLYFYTVSAINSVGEGTQSNEVSVTPQSGGATMHVSAIDMSYTIQGRNYTISIQVTVVDETGAPVSGATVYLSVDDPGGSTATGSGTTGSNGIATFSYRSKNTGTYVATVTDVTSNAYTYDSGANVVSSASLQVP